MRDYFGKNGWPKDAACRGTDPEIYYSPKDDFEVGQAKRVCQLRCPVKQDCLMHAIVYNELGIWGGFDEVERYTMGLRIRPRLVELYSQAGIFHKDLMRNPPQAA